MRRKSGQNRQLGAIARGYSDINRLLPRGLPLTATEAKTAARLLYREFIEKRTTGYRLAGVEVGQGTTLSLKDAKNARPPWEWEDIIVVNPQADWSDLIHKLSHEFHARLHSAAREHEGRHLQLEFEMVNWVVSHGWLHGKLR